MIDRRHARILALQALCQLDAQGEAFLPELDAFLKDEKPPQGVVEFARALSTKSWSRREEIDTCIRQTAENWELRRMATVDRNVLRVAVGEMMMNPETPANVIVNEAVDIAKEFGSRESGGFINGVLDGIVRALRPGAPARSAAQDVAEEHSTPAVP
jgi:N utilization substance protein B